MKKIILLVTVICALYSCKEVNLEMELPDGNTYYFENPQPINDSELKSIPTKFHGLYMNSDSVYININRNVITVDLFSKYKIPNTDLDSLKVDFDISNNEIISKKEKVKFSFRKLKDSIEVVNKDTDTIFNFSDSQKMKRINGNLVISKKDSIYWKIKLLTFNENSLVLKQLYAEEDLKKMDSITKIKAKKIDSITFIITPTRAEFKQFFKLKDFGHDIEFKRIKS